MNIGQTLISRHPTECDWVRLATLIDTEGNLHITGKKTFDLQITVPNTDVRLPIWCQTRFGGFVCLNEYKPRHKKTYRWKAAGPLARVIINGCFPYFISKREQAKVCVEFAGTFTGQRADNSILDRRWLLKHRLQKERKPYDYLPVEKQLIEGGASEEEAFREAAKLADEARRKRNKRRANKPSDGPDHIASPAG
jgi:hypothetical protein